MGYFKNWLSKQCDSRNLTCRLHYLPLKVHCPVAYVCWLNVYRDNIQCHEFVLIYKLFLSIEYVFRDTLVPLFLWKGWCRLRECCFVIFCLRVPTTFESSEYFATLKGIRSALDGLSMDCRWDAIVRNCHKQSGIVRWMKAKAAEHIQCGALHVPPFNVWAIWGLSRLCRIVSDHVRVLLGDSFKG